MTTTHLQQMEWVERVDEIARVGQAVEWKKIGREHFACFLAP